MKGFDINDFDSCHILSVSPSFIHTYIHLINRLTMLPIEMVGIQRCNYSDK
jgi:hypothetical protein